MGKTMRWLKSLLGVKTHHQKDKTTPTTSTIDNNFSKQTQGFIGNNNNSSKWFRECNFSKVQNDEQSKHAIAVVTATAAAADAALMAAHAAVAVVRLTSHRHGHRNAVVGGSGDRDRWAAVRIQSIFRGYLARRAHRALKGLVKLQAHVRGFLVRKRAAATLNSMQAMVRAQATVHSLRANQALAKNSKIHPEFRPRKSTERYDETKNDQFHSKRLSTSYEPYNNSIEGSPKIVEIDTFKPKSRSRRINNNNNNNSTTSMYDFSNDDFQYPTMSSPLPYPIPSRLSIPECQNINHTSSYYDWSFYGDEYRVSTAQNTPRFPNSVRSNVPLTPTKSVCGDGVFRPRSSHPSYMGDTQSFRAKLRSHSAPKQRPEGRSKKRLSLDDIMASRNSISGVRMQRSCSQQVQENLNF